MVGNSPSLERIEIDGIPAYWVESGGPFSGGLLFRAGRADEPLRWSGVSHLVEHLTLHTLGTQQDYAFNGFVSPLATGFMAQGEPEQVADFLRRVAGALADLPFARLEDEARVLRTEARQRTVGAADTLLWIRYGASGHGTMYLPEIMILAPDPESIRSWSAERYTAGNAALWFSGPPPKELRLDLRPGPRKLPPDPKPIECADRPMFAFFNTGGVAVSFVRPREDWLSLPLGITAKRLGEQLRHERGLVYEVASGYEPLNADLGHSTLWTSCLPEHAEAVSDVIFEVLDALGEKGATDEELATARKWFERQLEDRDRFVGELIAAATNELIGAPVHSHAESLRALAAIDGREIARRIAAAIPSALMLIPSNCPHPGTRFQQCANWSGTTLRGRTFRTSSVRWLWSKGPRLIVGPDGASFVTPENNAITVLFASCTAVVLPNGVVELFGEDGFRVIVDPGQWWNGLEAARLIQDAVPRERIARIRGDGAG